MMKNKKGFTLIELLAVIVILALITLLAFTKIRDYLVKSDKDAAETNAKIFVKAVNDMTSMTINDDVVYSDGGYTVSELKATGKLKVNGTLPTSGYVVLDDFDVDTACLIIGKYSVTFENGKLKDSTLRGTCDESDIPSHGGSQNVEPAIFAYTGNYESFEVPKNGIYKIELWGASGGLNSFIAPGAYTSGEIKLEEGETIFVYVGGKTSATSINTATYNGGGSCGGSCTSGGGATDVRLTEGPWNNNVSLASRIMVAAGGAGYDTWGAGYIGGVGGALTGFIGAGDTPNTAATQTSGGVNPSNAQRNGSFGKGGNGEAYGGGAGGGYYGGAGGANSSTGNGGAGGTSYISGYTGCVAITSASSITPKSGCSDGTTDNACSIHYSGKKFTNGVMKAGNESMPTFDGTSTMTGNSDSGYAKITYLRAG